MFGQWIGGVDHPVVSQRSPFDSIAFGREIFGRRRIQVIVIYNLLFNVWCWISWIKLAYIIYSYFNIFYKHLFSIYDHYLFTKIKNLRQVAIFDYYVILLIKSVFYVFYIKHIMAYCIISNIRLGWDASLIADQIIYFCIPFKGYFIAHCV